MAELTPGTEYFDYTIERLVGRGGFGAVYVARDRRLDRRVALKILEPHLAADPTARRRFIDESRLAAGLDHPNIVPIYEAGEHDERLFLAMRYVPGPDLADTLDRDGALEPIRAGRIVTQIASALDAAHAAGLVHRDVKPGNVLLAPGTESTDHVYLTDFGLSKRVGGAGAVSQTHVGNFVGTVGYVAPEQIKGRSIDSRADIYSLGCLAYHLLSGHQPFERDSEIGTLMAHAEEPPHSVHETLPDLADRVDPVIAVAMAKEPADRYPSAGAFAAALSAALSSRQPGANVTRGFLFADMRGYTTFIEEHGDDSAVRLLDAFRRMVRMVVSRFDGAEIKTEGDSFYVVFPSASAAVQAGLGIVGGADVETERRPELPISVGVGVHAGESSEWVEGYVGSSVNIAARLCAQAEPGEVLVSDTVRTLIRTSSKLEFIDRGQRTLKGIEEPLATWSAVPRDTSGAAAAAPNQPRNAGRRTGLSPAFVGIVAVFGLVVVAAVAWLLLTGSAPSDAPGVSVAELRDQIAFSRHIPEGEGGDSEFDACRTPLDAKVMRFDLGDPEAGPARLTRGTDRIEYWPHWSADGSVITLIGLDGVNPGRAPSQLYAVDEDGVRAVEVPDGMLGQYNGFAAVTDDGEHALWKGSDFRGRFHVVTLDGSDARTIAAGGDAFKSQLEDVLTRILPLPEDRVLTVWVGNWSGAEDEPYHEYFQTMALDGTDPVAVGPVLYDGSVGPLAVSPAGDQVLVGKELEDGSIEWNRMSLDGETDQLTPLGFDAWDATWSADGASVYLVRADAPGVLIEHDLATGEEREILNIGTGAICGAVARKVTPESIGLPPAPSANDPLPFEISLLEAETYRFDRFKPAPGVSMEATFGSGWLGRANYPDGWEAMHLDEPGAEFSASRILVGLPGPCAVEDGRVLEPGPKGFVDWIEEREDLLISSPHTVSVGGWPGVRFDVTPVPGTQCVYTDDWNLYLSEDDIIWMKGDETLELTAVDVNGSTVVIRKRATNEQMEAFSELVDPVLESVDFVELKSAAALTDG